MLDEREKRFEKYGLKPLTKTLSDASHNCKRYELRSVCNSRDSETREDNVKLFNSHLSIFNALINPDLELSPNLRNDELSKFPSPEFYIEESWQNISNDSIFRTFNNSPAQFKPSSLLSITTDENDNYRDQMEIGDAAMVANSMVFETEEEEEDDFKPSFVMPKMKMSSTSSYLKVCIISNNLDVSKLAIANVDLVNVNITRPFNRNCIENCKLIFIINDGSTTLLEFLKQNLPTDNEFNTTPKFIIVNLITCNFFGNLFEIINNFKPFQIWKASSLRDTKLKESFTNIVNSEISFRSEQPTDVNSSIYSSLIPTNNKNYKLLERQFKNELSIHSNNVDPLRLKKLLILSIIVDKFYNQPVMPSYNLLYVLVSFSVGISLGFGIARGISKYYGDLVADNLATEAKLDPSPYDYLDHIKAVCDDVKYLMTNAFNTNIIDDISKLFFEFVSNLRSTSSWVIDCFWGGFAKVLASF